MTKLQTLELRLRKNLLEEVKAEGNATANEIKFHEDAILALEALNTVAVEETTTFIVSARNKETNEIVVREYEAKSAKEAKKDFQDNGYAVRFVTTEENFDADCEAYNAKVEKQVSMRAIMKEVRKGNTKQY